MPESRTAVQPDCVASEVERDRHDAAAVLLAVVRRELGRLGSHPRDRPPVGLSDLVDAYSSDPTS